MIKPQLALYIGGMGARGMNFYNTLACRYGYAEAAAKVQDLYLSGQKEAAAAAIPDELVDEMSLCGPKARIAEKLKAWHTVPITTLIVTPVTPDAVAIMAEVMGS